MNPWAKFALALGGFFGIAALSRRSSGKPALGGATRGDDGRPIVVVGDSHAMGLALALAPFFPGRVENRAKVGAHAAAMAPIENAHAYYIVSAGTNDAAGAAPIDQIGSSILKVLGPYGRGQATQGAACFLWPNENMSGAKWLPLSLRLQVLRKELRPRLVPSARLCELELSGALGPDGIHFTPAAYQAIGKAALALLFETPSRVGEAVGSKSGLLPSGQIDPAFLARSNQIADELGMDRAMLLAVMWFESGGTFRSDIRNAAGSGAVGLIQWLPRYAPAVTGGKTADELAAMSAIEQLEFVRLYFQRWGSWKNRPPEDAYLAVFSPAMMGRPDAEVFYREGSPAYAQNKGLDADKDGAISVGEVRAKIRGAVAQVKAKGWA